MGRTDIRNFYEKSEDLENDYVSEKESHDSYYDIGLSDEAVRQINDYIEFIKQKYKLEVN